MPMVCYLGDYFDGKRVFKVFKGANGKFNNAFLLQSFPIMMGIVRLNIKPIIANNGKFSRLCLIKSILVPATKKSCVT